MRKHITATDFYNYTKCKYRVYRDKNTDQSLSEDVGYFMELIWQNGVAHEEKALSYFRDQKDKTFIDLSQMSESNLAHARIATLSAMKDGVNYIYQGILTEIGGQTLFDASTTYVGRPDILMKVDQPSALGSFSYVPVDIKSGTAMEETPWGNRFNPSYRAQLAFYGYILGKELEKEITEGYILDGKLKLVRYPINIKAPEFTDMFDDIQAMYLGSTADREVVISSSCGLCPWQSVCRKEAEETNNLTLLFYLGEKVKDGFKYIGIKSIPELADADYKEVVSNVAAAKSAGYFYKSFNDDLLQSLITRAQLYMQTQTHTSSPFCRMYAQPLFPNAHKEIHYDIEDDPMGGIVYMHGFWIIEEGKAAHYHSITATKDKTEKDVAQELWAFFRRHKGVPIYHYSGHEKHVCKSLLTKYGLEKKVFDDVFGDSGSAIDLYDWVFENTDWPLSSYGLKPLCKYTGFKWSAEDAGGANSIAWYYEYLAGDDTQMQKILTYNEEDCRATAHLKQWLENWFLKKGSVEK